MNNKTGKLMFVCMILWLALVGCGSSDSRLEQLELNDDFSEDNNGWGAGFADLPADYDNSTFELDSGRRELPSGLDGYGMYLQGHNRSDDLFMYLTKQLTGLVPDTTYHVAYTIAVATNVASGGIGVGGAPGESVFVKAGASTHQPIIEEMSRDGFLRLNIDKGNQSTDGSDMLTIGNVASPDVTDESQFIIKTLFVEDFEVTTDAEGNLWLIVGTDSGFEGLTTVYFTQIDVSLTAK
jgi:hypothetical protein